LYLRFICCKNVICTYSKNESHMWLKKPLFAKYSFSHALRKTEALNPRHAQSVHGFPNLFQSPKELSERKKNKEFWARKKKGIIKSISKQRGQRCRKRRAQNKREGRQKGPEKNSPPTPDRRIEKVIR